MKANKKKSTARRIARAIILLVVALLLYNIAGAYAPFIRCPQLDDPQAVEARADEMQSDIRTPDRVMLLHTHADALETLDRLELGITAPACGLELTRVYYADEMQDFPNG